MTQWIDDPHGGRDRGPRALARAWFEVLVRPQRFFRTGVAPGDQAPGLTFLLTVVLVVATSRYLLTPEAYPSIPVSPVLEGLFWISLLVFLVAPLGLHLLAAIQTLFLMVVARERAGISQTVQVIAYATAPCVFVGLPIPAVRLLACWYGTVLLIAGLRIVHELSVVRAILAGAIPAALVFGYGFGGFTALEAVTSSLPV
ncbi:YIP1 family protein [Natrialbaceae archaeon A-CW1-1]